MYGFICKECKKITDLTAKDGEAMYFRLGNSEEFYCRKCFDSTVRLEENDKVVREGKNFVTVQQSDY